jgi:hypothetical protein
MALFFFKLRGHRQWPRLDPGFVFVEMLIAHTFRAEENRFSDHVLVLQVKCNRVRSPQGLLVGPNVEAHRSSNVERRTRRWIQFI